jgi:hypothetical protein
VAPQCGKQWSEAAGLLCELLALLPPPGPQASAATNSAPAAESTPAATSSGGNDGAGNGGGGNSGCEAPTHLQPWPGFSDAMFRAWRQLLRLGAARPDPDAADSDTDKRSDSKRRRLDVSNGGDVEYSNSATCSAAHVAMLQAAGTEAGLPATALAADASRIAKPQEAQQTATTAGLAAVQPLQPTAAAIGAAAAQCMALAARHLKVCC